MKRILASTLLLANLAKPLTHWFNIVSAVVSSTSYSTIAGPNKEYVIHGTLTQFAAHTINWELGRADLVHNIDIGTDAQLSSLARVGSDNTFNCVGGSKGIVRFNAQQGVPHGREFYSVPTSGKYFQPFWTPGTNFVFISIWQTADSTHRRLYRLHSDRVSGMETFTTGAYSKAYGVLFGTPWLLVSLEGGNQRRIYDYTSGHQGGTDSALNTHDKQHTEPENGLSISDQPGKQYYVVVKEDTKKVYSTKWDGSATFFYDLATLDGFAAKTTWIVDSDLVLVTAFGKKIAFINAIDSTLPTPTYLTLDGTSYGVALPYIWPNYRAIMMPHATDTLAMYKAFSEIPCSDSCDTCDDVFRNRCLSCVSGATRSGDVCTCNNGYFLRNITPTRQGCLACSAFCGTCSAGGAHDCLTCKYSHMEKKGDGSCGCPDGKYLSGTQCLDCDGSCKTCSGPGASACLSCDVSGGKYLSGGTCLDCDASCKTCSGG